MSVIDFLVTSSSKIRTEAKNPFAPLQRNREAARQRSVLILMIDFSWMMLLLHCAALHPGKRSDGCRDRVTPETVSFRDSRHMVWIPLPLSHYGTVSDYALATDNHERRRIRMPNQQPKNSSTSNNTALIRKANVSSPSAILNTLSEPGLRKWEYPPIASGTAKNRRSQAPSLGKCAHNEIKASTGITFARPAKSGT